MSRLRRFVPVVLLALATAIWPRLASAEAFDRQDLQRIEKRVQDVAEKGMPSIVALVHTVGRGMASGTGTIVTPDGIILTAAHVVAGSQKVDVIFLDGTRKTATVLGGDADRDVALCRLNEPGKYPYTEMGHSNSLKVGDQVVAMGHPGGYDQRRQPPVRYGRIFNTNQAGYLRSDCILVGGDSGGPLFDLDGKLVGIHSSIGPDGSMNNHAPVDIAREGWDRMMAGEHWGTQKGGRPQLPKLPKAELDGLDLEKFQRRVLESGMRNGGRIAVAPKTIANWLREFGMKPERVDKMTDQELGQFVQKALGSSGRAEVNGPATRPTTRPATRPAGPAGPAQRNDLADLRAAGLNMRKFRQELANEAQKNQGNLKITPPLIAGWLKNSGMDAKKVDAMSPQDLVQTLGRLLGGNAQLGMPGGFANAADAKAISDQDKAVLATIKADLQKAQNTVVSIEDGKRPLALGTIVRNDGYILTKRSEIAKGKGDLKGRLTDGRTFDITKVQEFEDHDLALVKIDAKNLTAVDLPKKAPPVKPGSFCFAPGLGEDLLLAVGAVSVPPRSLQDSGGYMGIGLGEENGVVVIGMVEPKGPADKAGLKRGDKLLTLDGKPIKAPAELSRNVRGMTPGTEIKLKYKRGDADEETAEITLGDRSKLPKIPAERNPMAEIGTEVSDVRTGYPMILQHDAPIRPQDCGGPLIGLDGKLIGLNVARADRVESYAIPGNVIAELLAKIDFKKFPKNAEK